MKTYLSFYGDVYYPSVGMGDFIGDYESEKDAINAVKEAHKNKRPEDIEWEWGWGVVWSVIDRKEVFVKNDNII